MTLRVVLTESVDKFRPHVPHQWFATVQGLGLPFTVERAYPSPDAARADVSRRFPPPTYTLDFEECAAS